MMDEIIMSLMDRAISDEERIIKEAFEEKFGFPLDIRTAPQVQRLEMDCSLYVYYRYQGVDFLVIEKNADIQMLNGADSVSVTYKKGYKKL